MLKGRGNISCLMFEEPQKMVRGGVGGIVGQRLLIKPTGNVDPPLLVQLDGLFKVLWVLHGD